jgi:prenyltransferase beta subunit
MVSLLLIFLLTLSVPMAMAQDDDSESPEHDAAVAWLIDQQQADGSWTDGFSAGPGPTADAVFALAAADVDVHSVESSDGNTALDFFTTYLADSEAFTGAAIAKTVIALVAVDEDPTEFAGVDLVTWLLDTQDEDGVFVDDMTGIFGHCLVTIAIYNADAGMMEENNVEALEAAILALTAVQNEDGGFGFAFGSDSDTNTTAVCIQALAISEEEEIQSAIGAALEYLGQIQNEDGGWPYQNPSEFGTDSDSNSTSLVAQALIASEVDEDAWRGEEIASYLLGLQNESGAFGFNAGFADDNFLSTVAVIPVLTDTLLTDAWALAAEEMMEDGS